MEIKNNIIIKGAINQIAILILAAVIGYLIISHLPRIMTFIAAFFGQQ